MQVKKAASDLGNGDKIIYEEAEYFRSILHSILHQKLFYSSYSFLCFDIGYKANMP